MMMKRLSAILLGNLLLGGLFGISGLAAFFGLMTAPESSQAASPSFVRDIHASPFVGNCRRLVGWLTVAKQLRFRCHHDLRANPPGPHKVQIALVGKGIGASAITQTLAVIPTRFRLLLFYCVASHLDEMSAIAERKGPPL